MIDFGDRRQVAAAIQYTNVSPNLTRDEAVRHLETCAQYGFDAAMIAPVYCDLARRVLAGTGVKVASTLNFPQANDTLAMKIAALRELAAAGAEQFDFPPNPGLLLGGEIEAYTRELTEVTRVAHEEGLVVKAMLEFGFLDESQKALAAKIATEAGLDWIKNSSGWGVGGCAATVEDVEVLVANSQAPTRVKVSGKVNTLAKMRDLFEAGAELVGTSSGPAIVDGLEGDSEAY
ncbi:MAG: deoxyribose-phosphate aldolase [Actinomycetota bacterium]|nr:deoxyribose-phosphate aldolase [Actinomycetota bacterium]